MRMEKATPVCAYSSICGSGVGQSYHSPSCLLLLNHALAQNKSLVDVATLMVVVLVLGIKYATGTRGRQQEKVTETSRQAVTETKRHP